MALKSFFCFFFPWRKYSSLEYSGVPHHKPRWCDQKGGKWSSGQWAVLGNARWAAETQSIRVVIRRVQDAISIPRKYILDSVPSADLWVCWRLLLMLWQLRQSCRSLICNWNTVWRFQYANLNNFPRERNRSVLPELARAGAPFTRKVDVRVKHADVIRYHDVPPLPPPLFVIAYKEIGIQRA